VSLSRLTQTEKYSIQNKYTFSDCSMTKVIFLDRDGIINIDHGYVHAKENFYFLEGIFEISQYFRQQNYQIIICTNQSGISRGYYSETQYQSLTTWMLKEFANQRVDILNVLHCPHLPQDNCLCRKPKPGMLIEAKNKHLINMAESYIIGDKETDILAGRAAGLRGTILLHNQKICFDIPTKADYVIRALKDCKKYVK